MHPKTRALIFIWLSSSISQLLALLMVADPREKLAETLHYSEEAYIRNAPYYDDIVVFKQREE